VFHAAAAHQGREERRGEQTTGTRPCCLKGKKTRLRGSGKGSSGKKGKEEREGNARPCYPKCQKKKVAAELSGKKEERQAVERELCLRGEIRKGKKKEGGEAPVFQPSYSATMKKGESHPLCMGGGKGKKKNSSCGDRWKRRKAPWRVKKASGGRRPILLGKGKNSRSAMSYTAGKERPSRFGTASTRRGGGGGEGSECVSHDVLWVAWKRGALSLCPGARGGKERKGGRELFVAASKGGGKKRGELTEAAGGGGRGNVSHQTTFRLEKGRIPRFVWRKWGGEGGG